MYIDLSLNFVLKRFPSVHMLSSIQFVIDNCREIFFIYWNSFLFNVSISNAYNSREEIFHFISI